MKYKHYPTVDADREYKASRKTRYKITTINWTYTTDRGKVDYENVHKNEYIYTLPNLIKFIRDTAEVAEDILTIERVK